MHRIGANPSALARALGAALLFATFAGCGKAPAPPQQGKLPEVMVSLPVERMVLDSEDFTGRTDAKRSVTVRARVSGYLQKVCFKEGNDVKEGDVLFEIDPRSYQAAFDQADATVRQAEANLKTLQSNY